MFYIWYSLGIKQDIARTRCSVVLGPTQFLKYCQVKRLRTQLDAGTARCQGNKLRMSSELTKLVICGGGNGAHAWSGIASSQPNTEVRVLTLFQDEAQRWSDSLQKGDFTVSLYHDGKLNSQLKSKPKLVTKKPEETIPGCDVIAFVMPAFAHEQYLQAIKPYIEPGMILVGLPGSGGFVFQVRAILGDVFKQIAVCDFPTLPWATRLTEFGRACEVLGTKETMFGGLQTSKITKGKDPCAVLQSLLGKTPVVSVKGGLLGVTIMSTNLYLHPPIMYGRWHNWNNQPVDEKPLFYHGMDEEAASVMFDMSTEGVAVADALVKASPDIDMSIMEHIFDWSKRSYDTVIGDKSTLYTTITTNKAYNGLTHPMVQTEDGKWVPNFTYRYLTEDVPFGVVVVRGIAEIVGVATPNMDKVLEWAQEKLKKKYLVDGKIQGEDVKETRAPQRYGFTTLKDLIGE